jgi:protein SDA1
LGLFRKFFLIQNFFFAFLLFSLNTIREICAKSYLAMDEDLLHDLSKYKSYRDKSVSASARSLIQLFREKNPQILERKDRGKPTEFQRELIPLDYGQSNPKSYLEGAEILQQEQDNITNNQQQEEEEQEEEEEDWIEVSHSEEEEEEDQQENDEKVNIPSKTRFLIVHKTECFVY